MSSATLGAGNARGLSNHQVPEKSCERESIAEWMVYDIGGCHTSRMTRSWAPYFSSLTALIFMVPTSAYDMKIDLGGGKGVWGLEYSFELWKEVSD